MVSPRAADVRLDPDAAEFVRFCYRRRSVGWPDLYDEMCAVASRRLFRGWDQTALGDHGVGFGLFELPALAALTASIVAEEQAARSPQRSGRSDRGREARVGAAAPVDATSAGATSAVTSAAATPADPDQEFPPEDRHPAATSPAATSAGPQADRPLEVDPVEALALAS